MTSPRIVSILHRSGYVVYENPYQLNIVGMRSKSTRANRFDDEIHVFYKLPSGKWNYHIFKATTDPGTFWLENPSTPRGTSILAQGQYLDCYEIGEHRGLYMALVQKGPVNVIRDYNRDSVLDFNNGRRERGLYGINIHRASVKGKTIYVDEYSAGCQVFADATDFAGFMSLCEHHRQLYGNSFSYTLLDFRAMRRETIRRVAIASSVASTLLMGLFFRHSFLHAAA